jgi:hypothetical protein
LGCNLPWITSGTLPGLKQCNQNDDINDLYKGILLKMRLSNEETGNPGVCTYGNCDSYEWPIKILTSGEVENSSDNVSFSVEYAVTSKQVIALFDHLTFCLKF